MKRNVALTVTALLTSLLFSLHWADEVARGLAPGTMSGFGGIIILVLWLSAALVFPERRLGLGLRLLGGILAGGVTVLHMQGRGLAGGRYAANSVRFFWVWTNIALGAIGLVSAVLAAQELWRRRRSGVSALSRETT